MARALTSVTAGSGQTIQLVEVNGGAGVVRASQSYGFVSGTSYTITIATSGATIAVSVNGVQEINYASATSNQTATKGGGGYGVGVQLGQLRGDPTSQAGRPDLHRA